ncbi:MAG: hypothetical protein IPH13_21275 [Planctomycetes bacterium]|nr:hypothetical protein [Planctomycetota bacterium]MCC7170683.1 hypothetical protein [Planctomycetota bacterium]
MSTLRNTISILKPVIFVSWVVAAGRLFAEACTTDMNFLGMLSVYGVIAFLFLYSAFTGAFDALGWKGVFVGSLVLTVSCLFVPNAIAYTVGQFRGWNHGRFQFDAEHAAIQKPLMEKGMGLFEAKEESGKILGRPDPTRGPPIADTPGGKLKTGLTVAALTMIGGVVWSLLWGTLFIGIPSTIRRRRAGR